MKPYEFRHPCDYAKSIGGVSVCPELEEALLSGGYLEGGDWGSGQNNVCGPVEDIGLHRTPGHSEAYVYRLQSCRTRAGETWWHAYGEYWPAGRTAGDADYVFLDGGGYFAARSAALWAIHLWLAHLHRADSVAVPSREIHHGV